MARRRCAGPKSGALWRRLTCCSDEADWSIAWHCISASLASSVRSRPARATPRRNCRDTTEGQSRNASLCHRQNGWLHTRTIIVHPFDWFVFQVQKGRHHCIFRSPSVLACLVPAHKLLWRTPTPSPSVPARLISPSNAQVFARLLWRLLLGSELKLDRYMCCVGSRAEFLEVGRSAPFAALHALRRKYSSVAWGVWAACPPVADPFPLPLLPWHWQEGLGCET